MTTAIGTYATLAGVKARLDPTMGTSSDSLIQSLCDQVNGWIESKTGRVLAPIAAFSTTLNGGASSGQNQATLTSVTGLAVGDPLRIGTLAGTHEYLTVLSINGSVVSFVTNLANTYSTATAVKRILLQDGFGCLEDGRMMPYPRGIISITSLEVAQYTNGPFFTIPMTDVKLRPTPPESGWPYTELWMTDIPSSGNPSPIFFRGFDNIAADCLLGWPAVPDEIVEVATNLVVALWRGRASGGGDMLTIGTTGERTYERMLSYTDRMTIERYTIKPVEII